MRYQRLARMELPVDTAALARFLIGKVVVRETPEGVIGRLIFEAVRASAVQGRSMRRSLMEKPLPDIAEPGLSVIFCGLNPGLSAAATGHHFVGRSNRFWRVLHLAGFTPEQIEPEQDATLLAYGFGVTSVVERPTAGVDDLARREFVAAAAGFEHWVRRHAPRHVAFLGKAAYAAMIGRKSVSWGRQAEPFGGATAWVLPNPSGRNLAFSLEALVAAYRELRLYAEYDAAPDPCGAAGA
jgi:TDG/mug DNA glycosylase family protein